MSRSIKNVGDLKSALEDVQDEAPIFLGVWNGYSDTYCFADHAIIAPYDEIENDFFGTEGKMDKRIFNPDFSGKDIVYIGSLFDRRIKNKEIDFLDSDPNIPIHLINGKEGDPYLFWKSNGFEQLENDIWTLSNREENWNIKYTFPTKTIKVEKDNKYTYVGECIGIYDFFDIMKVCHIKKQWRIG